NAGIGIARIHPFLGWFFHPNGISGRGNTHEAPFADWIVRFTAESVLPAESAKRGHERQATAAKSANQPTALTVVFGILLRWGGSAMEMRRGGGGEVQES